MKILFVDHADHLKTHSADFFVEILRKSFDVETFYYEKTYQFTLPQDKVDSADVIVFWEFLYNRRDLGIPGKRCDLPTRAALSAQRLSAPRPRCEAGNRCSGG